jgi:hypothetical protein
METIAKVLGAIAVALLIGAATSYVLMLLWGFVLVPFGAPDFTYLQTWGLFILVGAFGGAFRGGVK